MSFQSLRNKLIVPVARSGAPRQFEPGTIALLYRAHCPVSFRIHKVTLPAVQRHLRGAEAFFELKEVGSFVDFRQVLLTFDGHAFSEALEGELAHAKARTFREVKAIKDALAPITCEDDIGPEVYRTLVRAGEALEGPVQRLYSEFLASGQISLELHRTDDGAKQEAEESKTADGYPPNLLLLDLGYRTGGRHRDAAKSREPETKASHSASE